MSYEDDLKKLLGDDVYKEKGKDLKVLIAKNHKHESEYKKLEEKITGLESEKKVLLEEKSEFEKAKKEAEAKAKQDELNKLSDLEKIQKQMEDLTNKLSESETKAKEFQTNLEDEKKTNSLKGILKDTYKMKPKFVDTYVGQFKEVAESDLDAKIKEFQDGNKELFGEERLKGDKPKGSFVDNKSDYFTKEQVESMNDEQTIENYEKIQESMKKWD